MTTISPLACHGARRRLIPSGSLTLAAREWGEPGRPGLCLLHGGAAHSHWFDRVAHELADGFHVLALDQRGHGESGWADPPAYATEDFAGDLLSVMATMGWSRMSLLGHSMGGHNAMAFAAWHPERLDTLLVVDSRPAIPPERIATMRQRGQRPPRLHPSLDAATAAFRLLPPETIAEPALLDHVARASYVQAEGNGAGRWRLRFDPACYAERRPADAWPLIGRIRARTLIVRGEHSTILPREMAERMRALVSGSSLAEVPDAYHHLVLDRPAPFVAVARAFLTSR